MNSKLLFSLIISMCISYALNGQTVTNDYYVVNAKTANGLKFWESDKYKIHMGKNWKYAYGPVTRFSIKTNMNGDAKDGWTWGENNLVPVMAANTEGKLQTAGWIKSMAGTFYFGDRQRIVGNKKAAFFYDSNHSSATELILRDKEYTIYGRLTGAGNGTHFGLRDSAGKWTYLTVKDQYTAFSLNEQEKMRIRADGNVGIGTASPTGKLSIISGQDKRGVEILSPHGDSYFPYSDGYSYVSGEGVIFRSSGNTERMRINPAGKVVIGDVPTESNNYKLFVETGILSEKVRVAVKNTTDWADDVFADSYKKLSVNEVSEFIEKNKHLPNVPSADEVVDKGIDVAQMDAILLRQIEELWLHMIEVKKENELLKLKLESK